MQNVLPRSGARAYTVSDDASADQRYYKKIHPSWYFGVLRHAGLELQSAD